MIKLASVFIILSMIFAGPVFAQTQTCVQVYGGGVVCGASTPPHEVVSTGLGDNLAITGGALILASGILLYLRKRIAL